MASRLAATSYSRGGFSPCLSGSARRVMVLGGSTFHLEPGKNTPLIEPYWYQMSLMLYGFTANFIFFDL